MSDAIGRLGLSAMAEASLRSVLAREDVILDPAVAVEYVEAGRWDEQSAVDMLSRHARERPGQPALIDEDGRRLTFAELDRLSDGFAESLVAAGVAPGEAIGIQLPNWSEFFIAHVGAMKVKVLPVNLHMTYRSYELTQILGHSGARVLVVPGVLKGFDYEELGFEVQKRLGDLQVLVARGVPRHGSATMASWVVGDPSCSATSLERRPNGFDLALLLVSSGTTGTPKLVMHTHNSILYAGKAYRELLGFGPDDRWIMIPPVGHSTAVALFFWTSVLNGSSTVLQPIFDPKVSCRLIEREQITHMIAATPMLAGIASVPSEERGDLGSMRLIIYGGAPCPPKIILALNEIAGCNVIPFYGWSEGGGHTATPADTPVEITSARVGLPVPGCEGRLVDPTTGEDVPPGQPGEFWGRGPNIPPGYFHQPENTRKLMTRDGWFRSGDLLVLEADGFYRYIARTDDVINRGGQKIDPKEVEDLLFQHPNVANVVVVGRPDPRLGEISVAFVVPASDPAPTLAEIQHFLSERGLAKWKWPECVEVLESIPVNAGGKIQRFLLRELAAKHEGGNA
ncbi:MAG: AMP-binding protein [Actinomycetota bacterium]|jgi:acyl-CoA synthetase (AMP-forming)/AMP-acid ligase II